MKKKEKEAVQKCLSKEEAKPKRLNALGEWFYSPDRKPLIKIIDMRAVMR